MVGIDHDEVVLQAIKDGFVNGTMLQNPYGQGYIGSYVLDKLRTGCTLKADAPWKSNALTAKFVDSGTVFVDAAQVDTYVDAMRGITKDILANFEKDYMDLQVMARSLSPCWGEGRPFRHPGEGRGPASGARSGIPAFAGMTARDDPLTDITDTRDDIMPARRQGSGALRLLLSNEFGLAVLIAIAFTAFAVTLPGFTSPFSLFTIGRQIGIDTMIGLAMMAVIVTGGLDLSVGAIGVCAAMVFGWLAQIAGRAAAARHSAAPSCSARAWASSTAMRWCARACTASSSRSPA